MDKNTHIWIKRKTLQKLSETLGRENLKHNSRVFIRNGKDGIDQVI